MVFGELRDAPWQPAPIIRHDERVTRRNVTRRQAPTRKGATREPMTPGERLKARVLFVGGSLTAALGVVAMASGELGRGTSSLVIGLAGLVIGAKRAQGRTAGAGDTKATESSAWYTTGLGLALMGGGAAATVFARRAEGRMPQVVLFLLAGLLLWAGVTCLVAAAVATRRRKAR